MRLTFFLVSVITVAVLTTSATVSSKNEVQAQPQLMLAEIRKQEREQRKCRSARQAVSFYRSATHVWQLLRDAESLAGPSPLVRGKSCRWARYAASEWQERARSARVTYKKWVERWTLKDFRFAEGNHAWSKAVREAQRVFPGTESWLLSCSSAEGGHGRWVGFDGVPYSTWLRDSNTVGGPMQFRFGTFTWAYNRGLAYVRSQRFRVPLRLNDVSTTERMTVAWRSALGQAIAAGWARYTGSDGWHWKASWGNGC